MRKYEKRVRRGMELLNKVYTRRWLRWIDLDRLEMSMGRFDKDGNRCGCVGAQIDAITAESGRGRYSRTEDAIHHHSGLWGEDLGLSLYDRNARNWRTLTTEWERQIREARGEEVKG